MTLNELLRRERSDERIKLALFAAAFVGPFLLYGLIFYVMKPLVEYLR